MDIRNSSGIYGVASSLVLSYYMKILLQELKMEVFTLEIFVSQGPCVVQQL